MDSSVAPKAPTIRYYLKEGYKEAKAGNDIHDKAVHPAGKGGGGLSYSCDMMKYFAALMNDLRQSGITWQHPQSARSRFFLVSVSSAAWLHSLEWMCVVSSLLFGSSPSSAAAAAASPDCMYWPKSV